MGTREIIHGARAKDAKDAKENGSGLSFALASLARIKGIGGKMALGLFWEDHFEELLLMNHMPGWLFFVLIASGVALYVLLLFFLVSIPLRKISRLYPGGSFTGERTYRHVLGLRVRGPSVDLAVGKEGMGISMSSPFRWLCPRIFIPWSAVYAVQGKPSTFGCDSLSMDVSRLSVPLWFEFLWRHRDVLSVIQKYWEEGRENLPKKAILQSDPA